MFNWFAEIFDWISPTLAIAGDLVYGPSYTFLIPENCGRSGRSVAGMLRRHGIKTWGHMIVKGHIMISVKQQQARWSQYLLDREGIPYRNGRIPDGDIPANRPAKPQEKQGRADWKEELLSLFDM
jgi:hypothetical protein